MTKHIRKIQPLNRIAIPQELMEKLEWEISDHLMLKIQGDGILIKKLEV